MISTNRFSTTTRIVCSYRTTGVGPELKSNLQPEFKATKIIQERPSTSRESPSRCTGTTPSCISQRRCSERPRTLHSVATTVLTWRLSTCNSSTWSFRLNRMSFHQFSRNALHEWKKPKLLLYTNEIEKPYSLLRTLVCSSISVYKLHRHPRRKHQAL